MRALDIARAPRQDSRHWEQGTITWEELLEWVETPAAHKACGNYVLGRIEPSTVDHPGRTGCTDLHRQKSTVVSRSSITLDADSARGTLPNQVQLVLGCRALIHTTYRSTPDQPRYRLLFPTDRDMTPDEYTRATSSLMQKLGQDQFDVGSAQPERFMFRPSAQRREYFEHWAVDGDLISVDELLADYVEPSQVSAPAATPVAQVPIVDKRYVRAAVAGALRDLVELCALPEGGRTDWDHGWDTGTYLAARKLIMASNTSTVYTLDDAKKDFMEHAPAAEGTYDPAHKWRSALKDVGEAVLVPQGSGAEDFGPSPYVDPMRTREDDSRAAGSDAPGAGRSSWAPVDLTGYLDGTYQPSVPSLLTRDDGVSLLYPGLTHSIHGEPESGKSMLVQYEAARVLMGGEPVLYLDFESDPGSMVERLVALGASREAIGERFHYLRPATDPDRSADDLAALYATLGAYRYPLAVIDGVSESVSVVVGESKDPNATAIEWARKVPQRIADQTGAAVVQIDHVTKNSETRGRFAIGGQAKLSTLTGAAYGIDVVKPLGRGLRGELILRVAKDRPGYVRGRCGEHRASDRLQEAARIIVDSTGGDQIIVSVTGPSAVPTAEQAQALLMARVSNFLATLGDDHSGASTAMLRREVRGNNDDIVRAVQTLVDQGYVSRTVKGQSNLHRLVKPYVPDGEAFEDD